jgi:hypothetical protein
MKMPSSISKLLENKYVLYIVFFLAVTNVFGYMVMGNYKAIALFVLVGYLVFCFNKNMIVVLLTSLVLTSVFMAGGIIKEGAQNMKDGDKTTTPIKSVKNAADSNIVKPTAAPKDKKKPVEKKEENINETEDQVGTEEEPTGDIQDAASGMTTMYKKGNRIDYASTVEDAYGDLNKILGVKPLIAFIKKI